MFTIPNLLSLMRIPLALLFLKQNIWCRSSAIILAMITDGLDGYIARRFGSISRFGTLLDPLMDRFFVFFIIAIFISENQLSYLDASALICRDFSVMLFGFYLVLSGKLSKFRFRAIWCGKVTTSLQFIVLLAMTFKVPLPSYTYSIFIILGFLALAELYLSKTDPLEIVSE
jgi:CDP-diacylglycerol--glycerol-3-phosphate 3-phosphatidyltransferase